MRNVPKIVIDYCKDHRTDPGRFDYTGASVRPWDGQNANFHIFREGWAGAYLDLIKCSKREIWSLNGTNFPGSLR
jgi:hypothetical protein